MARFFIDRPVFAWVLAILVMLLGVIAIQSLPIAQYPTVAPPAVTITVVYPGASAQTLQSTVVQVIEQQLSGIDRLIYFSSESNKDGSATITLSFEQGTDPDIAQVQVQNKVTVATPLLPQEVQAQGVRVAKATKNFLLVIAFVSQDSRLSSADISDFIASSVQDPISRTKGVGDYQLLGSQYAMRVWVDPAKLNNYGLTPIDVRNAIAVQNVQVAAGELGGLPSSRGQQLNATIIGPSRLQKPEEFGRILLKVQADGAQVRLSDVARIELDAQDFAITSKYNGRPAGGIGIKLATNANALETADAAKATVERLRSSFPPGLDVAYPYDTTPFVRISIKDVVKTLVEAVVLVFLVMLLFLQSFRATIIPTIAVPVVLLGTFGVLAAFGYSINVLTMFAMVLAIGLLVDDAIVVVENVERVMAEEHLSPLEATRKSMDQITGALVGIGLVLSAVFLPMAFFGGSTGVIYRQFSITMVSAMTLSVLVAIIFTPALCATILKPHDPDKKPNRFAAWFNRVFDRGNSKYEGTVKRAVTRPVRWMIAFLVIVVVMSISFAQIKKSFLPDEDQGVMFVQLNTPPGATVERTQAALDRISANLLDKEQANVKGVFTVTGYSFGGRGQTSGLVFISLKDWSERKGDANDVKEVAKRLQGFLFGQVKDALGFAFSPPALPELGNATGFDMELKDLNNQGHAALMSARNQFLGMAAQDKRLLQVRPNGLNDEPQYLFDVNYERASALGLTIADINNTMAAAWGSQYVNDFVDRGRVKRVFVQGDVPSRMLPEDLTSWHIRNGSGQMVPFSAFATATWGNGSPKLERYNGVPAVQILGSPADDQTTGIALDAAEELAKKLPPGFSIEWTGLSYEERSGGSQTYVLYGISLLIVFLCLAALYESWSIPVAVMLVVPLGIIGAVVATLVRGLDNDVFFQVGLLTTVGLAAKNAILIVEFAKENHDKGMELLESAVHAAHQRLRPILMTSLAFTFGVLPLALSNGAGSGGQNAIGTGVVGGMISATVLAIFFVPVFFVVVGRIAKFKTPAVDGKEPTRQHGEGPDPAPHAPEGTAHG